MSAREDEDALREGRDLRTDPRAEHDKRACDREDARKMGNRRILDLRCRLDGGDEEPHDRRNADDRKRNKRGENERLLRMLHERRRGDHDAALV